MAFATTIDVPALIDRQPIGRFQIHMVVLCFAVLVVDGYDALAIGNVGPVVAQALHIPRPALGPVFSAGVFGVMLGSLLFGSLADWLGRRRMIIASTVFFGVCTLLTVRAKSVESLLALRFATGLGLGGAFPNTIALMSEFAPRRARATLVTLMQTGFGAGAALSGVVVAWLVDTYGWKTVFYAGGAIPLLLTPFLVARLPESIGFRVIKGESPNAIAALLLKINPRLQFAPQTTFVVREENRGGAPVFHLFRDGRALGTTLLWIACFANILALSFLVYWLPTLINSLGIPVRQAVWSAVLYHGGGIVGGVVIGRLADLRGTYRVLPIVLAAGAIVTALAGAVGAVLPLILTLSLGMGFCIAGGQIGLNALSGAYYPTYMRSTGVGWALGIGRSGAVAGGLLGTLLLAWRWSLHAIFLMDGFFALCAATAILLMSLSLRTKSAAPAPA
jgi:AAHS family 4-hydroxybenzoate transporter-like MFS transporter